MTLHLVLLIFSVLLSVLTLLLSTSFIHSILQHVPKLPPDFDTEFCTLEICSIKDALVQYRPTVVGNSLFLAIFSLLLIAQIIQGVRYKTWGFLFGMAVGLVLEIIGYAGRLWLRSEPFSMDPFLMQIVCLTIGPAFFAGAIYITLGRIIEIHGPQISRLRPRTYSLIFVTLDFISLVLQAAGGAIASSSDESKDVDMGVNIMIAGLAFQVFSLLMFYAVLGRIHFTVKKSG